MGATGLYYDISGYRHPIPSLEVETEPSWRATGQFVDIVYPFGQSEYSQEFYGNSRVADTGLYYDISDYRHPIPSLEVETEPTWRATGQFVDVVYPHGQSGHNRLAM